MDAVSYSLASKQAQRIEKFIENPDSTSGIVTVPKTIASGETVTVPAGRVAVLPNLQIDGTLDIQGDVFIPSGSTFGDLDAQIALKANIDSPSFTGTPTAPTPTAKDNSTRLATTAYVDGKFIRGTAVASTTGTSIDFTGIPSWAKRITVIFDGVSTNGSSSIIIKLGSGTIESSGYFSTGSVIQGSLVGTAAYTTGFGVNDSMAAAYTKYGTANIVSLGNNTYCFSSVMCETGNANPRTIQAGGSKALSGTLDRVRITTVNGTDAFDAGQINIMYEG